MKHLIDKAIIDEKIEKRQKMLDLDNPFGRGGMIELQELKNFLDTLDVKRVDLKKEIDSYFKGFGMFPSVGIADCIDIATHFFELGLKAAQKGE